jgi:hypothetical protein
MTINSNIFGVSSEDLAAVNKIDGLATLGLAGVSNSLAYRVHEIEKHFHNDERWFGKSSDQSGVNPWATSISAAGMRTSFRATSGSSAFGADANDEALCWGVNDTLSVGGVSMTKLDFHEIFVTASSVTTIWYLRFIYGSGTMVDAITAGQYSCFPLIADAAQNGSIDIIVPVMMPRITIGTHKIWVQGKNATDNATIDFLFGVHGYVA